MELIQILLMSQLITIGWSYQQCNIICDDLPSPSHTAAAAAAGPIRGKAGPKGEKGEAAEVCECPPLQDIRVEMARMKTELTNKVSALEEKVKRNRKATRVPHRNDRVTRCGLLHDVDNITDSAFTATSVYSSTYYPYYARLDGSRGRGWTPLNKDLNVDQWLQVDLGRDTEIFGIATQGSCCDSERPLSYILLYRTADSDSDDFLPIIDGSGNSVVFAANTDQGSTVVYNLPYPVSARWWRINPRTWNSYPTLRLELFTC